MGLPNHARDVSHYQYYGAARACIYQVVAEEEEEGGWGGLASVVLEVWVWTGDKDDVSTAVTSAIQTRVLIFLRVMSS